MRGLGANSLCQSISKFEKVFLYETSSFFYLIGSDELETKFRVLKLDRRKSKPDRLDEILLEDPIIYTKDDLTYLLRMIHEGNKGGLVKIAQGCGVVGFVKFLGCFYLTIITQKKKVGCIGGDNNLYTIKATEVFAITPREGDDSNAFMKLWRKVNKKINQTSAEIAESRYMGLFNFVDVTKDFFFSYTYDLSHSIQHNFIQAQENATVCDGEKLKLPGKPQDIFVWNHYQTEELQRNLSPASALNWVMPIIHGSIQQRRFSILGRTLDMILIARRSRHYAGTRYLKRGVSVHGKVANDCEIEHIMQLDGGAQSQFCTLLQMRGSIPTYWSQETSVTQPKPPIVVSRIDPTYLATQVHFADMIKRYNLPIIVLDLVKQHERRPREVIVGKEYRQALDVVNSTMPLEHQIRYFALDYTRISKSKQKSNAELTSSTAVGSTKNVTSSAVGKEWDLLEKALGETLTVNDTPAVDTAITKLDPSGAPLGNAANAPGKVTAQPMLKIDLFGELDDIATYSISETAFFCSEIRYIDRVELLKNSHKALAKQKGYLEQSGVLRTNCIDCLDRTNGGQFALGMKFLNTSLRVLGLNDHKPLDPSNKLLMELMEMYGEVGDRIAVQYGGSEAHNKMAAGKGQKSSSKKGELLTSIKRYYSNAFTDNVKQDAMNLFLGCFQPGDQSTALWDLDTDYHLHNLTLNPPEPYIHKVVFNEMLKDIKYFLSTNQNPYTPQSPLMAERPVEFYSSAGLELGKEIFNLDIKAAILRYFIKSLDFRPAYLLETQRDMMGASGSSGATNTRRKTFTSSPEDIPLPIHNSVVRSEKRRFISQLMKTRMNEAMEHWWRRSVAEYEDNLHRVNVIYRMPEYIPSRRYFDLSHRPYELTSFDEILANTECFAPIIFIEIAEDSLESSEGGGGIIKPRVVRRTLSDASLDNESEDISGKHESPALNPRMTTDFDDSFDNFLSESRRTKYLANEFMPSMSTGSIQRYQSGSSFSGSPLISAMPVAVPVSATVVPLQRSDSKSNFFNALSKPGGDAVAVEASVSGVLPIARPANPASATPGAVGATGEFSTIDSDWGEMIASSQYYDELVARSSMAVGPVVQSISGAVTPEMNALALSSLQKAFTSGANANLSFNMQSAPLTTQNHRRFGMPRVDSPINTNGADDDTAGMNGNPTPGGIGQFSRYVREIGQKARFLVGGFLRKEDSNNTMGIKSNGNDMSANGQMSKWGWDSSHDLRFSKAFSQKTLNMYAAYAECSANPMAMMQPYSEPNAAGGTLNELGVPGAPGSMVNTSSVSHPEFVEALRECSIDVDNVRAMEQLSADSYVSRLINRGDFKGLSQLDDAQLASNLISNFLVFVESDLRSGFNGEDGLENLDNELSLESYDGIEDQTGGNYKSNSPMKAFPDAGSAVRASVYVREPVNNDHHMKGMAFEMPKYTHCKLYELTEKLRLSAGIEATILHQIHRYLFEQVYFMREINKVRLSRRMSSMTYSKNIIDYASLFHKEILAADLDNISFMVADPVHASHLSTEIDWFMDLLRPFYQSQRERKEEYLKALQPVQKDSNGFSRASSSESLNGRISESTDVTSSVDENVLQFNANQNIPVADIVGKELILEVIEKGDAVEYLKQPPLGRAPSNVEYAGFSLIDPDVYIRQTNPFLIMNEIAVIMFSRVHFKKLI